MPVLWTKQPDIIAFTAKVIPRRLKCSSLYTQCICFMYSSNYRKNILKKLGFLHTIPAVKYTISVYTLHHLWPFSEFHNQRIWSVSDCSCTLFVNTQTLWVIMQTSGYNQDYFYAWWVEEKTQKINNAFWNSL